MSTKLGGLCDSKTSSSELRTLAKNWFRDEVFVWRCAASLAWCMLLQWMYLEVGVLFVGLVSSHKRPDAKVLMPSCLSYFSLHLLLAVLNLCVALIHVGHYTVKPTVHLSHLKQIIYDIHPKRFLHLLFHGVVGAATASIFMKFLAVDYSDFLIRCEKEIDFNCHYSERHLFIFLHGIYSGVWYSIRYFIRNCEYVEIPIIQQLKFHVLKGKLSSMFYQTVRSSLKPIVWFYLAYYSLGSLLEHFILTTIGLHRSEQPSLTELGGIIDLELFLVTWAVSVLIQLKWNTFLYLFQTFVTERCTFLIDAKTAEDRKKCLAVGLQCNDFPLFQYLSYMDLCIVAKQSFEKRQQIFSISQPGGHPYHWDTISSACLTEIKLFLSSMNNITGNFSTKSIAMQNGHSQQHPGLPFLNTSPVSSPLKMSYNQKMNSLIDTTFDLSVAGRSPWQSPTKQQKDKQGKQGYEIKISKFFSSALTYLKNLHFVKFFTMELPDTKVRCLYAECLPVIFAIEALCQLVSASYEEDRYGVVQRLLPAILSNLVDMQQAIDGQQKGNILPKKHQKDNTSQKEIHLRQRLKSSLTNGIYHIVYTFNDHLNSLPLSLECKHHLHCYLQFAE